MRFYAEVPIHSPTGHVIGTYCVVDNKPREGLDKPGLAALSEIASAIMKHLELVQMQQGLQKAGEMVKGLEQFVDRGSNVREGWNAGFDTSGDFTTSTPGTVHTVSGSSFPRQANCQRSLHRLPWHSAHLKAELAMNQPEELNRRFCQY